MASAPSMRVFGNIFYGSGVFFRLQTRKAAHITELERMKAEIEVLRADGVLGIKDSQVVVSGQRGGWLSVLSTTETR